MPLIIIYDWHSWSSSATTLPGDEEEKLLVLWPREEVVAVDTPSPILVFASFFPTYNLAPMLLARTGQATMRVSRLNVSDLCRGYIKPVILPFNWPSTYHFLSLLIQRFNPTCSSQENSWYLFLHLVCSLIGSNAVNTGNLTWNHFILLGRSS